MSHAEHFLSRLVRLAGSEVELALELYRDPEWVRTLIAPIGWPDGTDRLAVSLDDPDLGPFIVLTREGNFVTCLGRGMNPGALKVVGKDRLEAASRQMARARTRIDLRRQADSGESSLEGLLRQLFMAPDSLSREDFLEVAAWEPLLGSALLDTYLAMGSELVTRARVLRRERLPKRLRKVALREYWNLLHAAGHLALLGSMAADRGESGTLSESGDELRAALSYPLTGTGVTTFMLKGSWAAARLGKPMVQAYKRALGEDVAFFELVDTILSLLALGRRSRKLRVEIKKALLAAPRRADNPHAERLRAAMATEIELVCSLAAGLLDEPTEQLEEQLLRMGQSFFEETIGPDDTQARDLARTFPLISWVDGITDGRKLMRTLMLVAASARLRPEQFYLPRDVLAEVRQPWTPERTLMMLEPIMKVERGSGPTKRDSAKVGRNAACPCGSGRKYKRCCARNEP